MKKFLIAAAFALAASFASAQSAPPVYVCKCDTVTTRGGQVASPTCAAGNDENDGASPVSPKLNPPADWWINSRPTGLPILFCRGGAWNDWVPYGIENSNGTATAPFAFDAYTPPNGATAQPIIRVTSANMSAFIVGAWGPDQPVDRGIVIRNLHLEGPATDVEDDSEAISINGRIEDALVENNTIVGFKIGIHTNDGGNPDNGARNWTIRSNTFYRNTTMGIMGGFHDTVIEGNTFEETNYLTGSGFHHPIYLGCSRECTNIVVRNNLARNNSAPGGVCSGGNFTGHGRITGITFEDNVLEVEAATNGCYGIALTPGGPGYSSPAGEFNEFNRGVIIRRNKLKGFGGNYITVSSAPNALIERNVLVANAAIPSYGIVTANGDATDQPGTAAVVRHNTCAFEAASSNSACVLIRNGANNIVANNVVRLGPQADSSSRCFEIGNISRLSIMAGNHCFRLGGVGRYADLWENLADAQAVGWGINDTTGDPLFVALPTAANGYQVTTQAGSPLRGSAITGGRALSELDVNKCLAGSTPDKGAVQTVTPGCLSVKSATGLRQLP
jgi:hypothetical protein